MQAGRRYNLPALQDAMVLILFKNAEDIVKHDEKNTNKEEELVVVREDFDDNKLRWAGWIPREISYWGHKSDSDEKSSLNLEESNAKEGATDQTKHWIGLMRLFNSISGPLEKIAIKLSREFLKMY